MKTEQDKLYEEVEQAIDALFASKSDKVITGDISPDQVMRLEKAQREIAIVIDQWFRQNQPEPNR